MKKYKIIYHWSNGEEDEDDNYGNYYDSYEEADSEGLYGLSCRKQGAEILEMSNPGDYPLDENDFENDTYEIVEIDIRRKK